MGDQFRGETVVRLISRAKVKSTVMVRDGRGQSGKRWKGPQIRGSLNLGKTNQDVD